MNTNYELTSFVIFVIGFIFITFQVSLTKFKFDEDEVADLKAEVVNYKAEVVNLKLKDEVVNLKAEIVSLRGSKLPDIIDSDSKSEPEVHEIKKSTALDSL